MSIVLNKVNCIRILPIELNMKLNMQRIRFLLPVGFCTNIFNLRQILFETLVHKSSKVLFRINAGMFQSVLWGTFNM